MAMIAPNSFTVSDKRQRVVTVARANRPIDKKITVIAHTVDLTQVSTTVAAPTFPSTMVGLRWNFTVSQTAGTGIARGAWAIVYLREGETVDALSFVDGATFYNPEQNCLTWGYIAIDNGSNPHVIKGSTKTMRKLMVGDTIIMTSVGTSDTDVIFAQGGVQLFLKG